MQPFYSGCTSFLFLYRSNGKKHVISRYTNPFQKVVQEIYMFMIRSQIRLNDFATEVVFARRLHNTRVAGHAWDL